MNPTFWLWCSGFCVGCFATGLIGSLWYFTRREAVDIKTVVVLASREGFDRLNRLLAEEAAKRKPVSRWPNNDTVNE